MRCPFCGEDNDRVLDSRTSEDGRVVRRRRQCQTCERKFTTKEYIIDLPMMVIKTDERRESFNREKLQRGIEIACSKRPIPRDKIEEVVEKVQGQIQDGFQKEVSSKQIGEFVIKYLKELDEVAYVRFASVYRKFQDTEEFLKELQSLIRKNK
ncbi:transcriptional repressor NrdR [bacterium BMS3Abin05]|nr:transcriptional repressor NrdR [bacterium BMS3Abin05]GBE28073.1 transcriptional repressor NrdR [bacterium BMS3Bbin03]HDK36151.1 transcriptional repressor NrdR [Bacteroidota bacterium]HDL78375.1 transcriptional repressor NrdR [Bacteroidota bacterium]HDZ12879.1 transcriptional repressor NrdR [Bacteroidota bacterium]